jgi:hypothetical protein
MNRTERQLESDSVWLEGDGGPHPDREAQAQPTGENEVSARQYKKRGDRSTAQRRACGERKSRQFDPGWHDGPIGKDGRTEVAFINNLLDRLTEYALDSALPTNELRQSRPARRAVRGMTTD